MAAFVLLVLTGHAAAAPASRAATALASAPAAEAKWSEPVNGLQCRLYVAPYDPAKSRPIHALTFELRNAGDKPIAVPAVQGSAPFLLHLHIADHPDVLSPAQWGGVIPRPYILQPKQTWAYRVGRDYLIAYGRLDRKRDSWARFDGEGKTYRLSVTMAHEKAFLEVQDPQGRPGTAKKIDCWSGRLVSNEVSLHLPGGV